MSSSSFSAPMSLASSSSDVSSPFSPSSSTARSLRLLPESTMPTAAAVEASPFGGSTLARPRSRRGDLGCKLPPPPLLRGSSSTSPSFLLAGSTHEKPILIEDDEIPRLDDIIHQAECEPDPVYLDRLLKTKEHVCEGSQPSVFCITHRR